MRTIYLVFNEDYETEAFYDEQDNQIAQWSCNDAQWRDEYMNPLLEKLGIVVKLGKKKHEKALAAELEALYGNEMGGDEEE